MSGFNLVFSVVLYFAIGCLIDEIAKGDEEGLRSYLVVAIWPILVTIVIVHMCLISGKRITAGMRKTTEEARKAMENGEDDLDEWNI